MDKPEPVKKLWTKYELRQIFWGRWWMGSATKTFLSVMLRELGEMGRSSRMNRTGKVGDDEISCLGN